MSDSKAAQGTRAPRHLWVIGVIALLWNAVGAMDYLMTQTRNQAYLSGFSQEQLAFFYGFPAWLIAAWAIGVWGGVFGSLLLLFRRRPAVWVFLASVLGVVVTAFHNYALANGLAIGGAGALGFTAVIFLVALGLYFYARAMARRGVLM